MKHLYKKTLLLLILMMVEQAASAYDCQVGGIYYNLDKINKTAEVTYVSISPNLSANDKAYTGTVDIPSKFLYEFASYKVVSIGNYAFSWCDVKSVNIPNSVTAIGNYAFYQCARLTSITIPNSVTTIGDKAFLNCRGLTSITISNSVISIGRGMLSGCERLEEIVLESGNTKYDSRDNCNAIISSTDNTLIAGCGNSTIPYGVIKIDDYAFSGSGFLTNVTIPNSVTCIGDSVFAGCSFWHGITLPNSLTTIGNFVFQNCRRLTDIEIPNGVTSIGSAAFMSCSELANITIPNSVYSIGAYAFYATAWYENQPDGLVYVGNVAYKYKGGYMPENTSIALEEGTKGIATSAFESQYGLTSITLPKSLVFIGDKAFQGCRGLTNISIPDGVTSISNYAFYNCEVLSSITIGTNITKIGDRAFSGCIGLTNIIIPNSVTTIGSYAFSYCGITSITIPNGITTIGSGVFSGCRGLTSITIPSSVTTIGDWAFAYCKGLTSFTIPSNVTTIGSHAFWECRNLEDITIPSNVTKIGKLAFCGESLHTIVVESGNSVYDSRENCNAVITTSDNTLLFGCLRTIIPSSVKCIGDSAFCGMELLRSISIPEGVTTIGNSAFGGCGLRSVTLPNSVTTIGNSAFSGKLGSATIGNNLTTIGKNAFPACKLYVNKDYISLLTLLQNDYWDNIYDTSTRRALPIKSLSNTKIVLEEIADSVNVLWSMITIDGVKAKELSGLEADAENVELTMSFNYKDTFNNLYYLDLKKTLHKGTVVLTTSTPRVATPGNVIVAAESNIVNDKEKVGFEWRRTDWADDFASNEGAAFLFEGNIEGYIRNLNTEKLWKVRPYYESASGKRYYGEWVGLDPTNTSYFEPTVHTYAKVEVQGNTAHARGYVMRGSDNVTSQGFKYWPDANGSRGAAPSVPKDAMTVVATGTVMEAELTGLDYVTSYCYAAFATTSEGETFYGEQQRFTTGSDPSGIEEAVSMAAATPVAYYDLNGRRLSSSRLSGMVIVRMSDGTTRKVMMR